MTRAQNKTPGVAGPIASFRARFAASVSAHQSLLVSGAADALSARIIADIGFGGLVPDGCRRHQHALGLDMGWYPHRL